MRIQLIGSLTSVAASTAISTQSAGLLAGEVVPVLVGSPTGAFVGTASLQTSVDGTTWTNVGPSLTTAGVQLVAVPLSNFIRLNCTAFTSGSIAATAFNDLS